jgi:adenosine kinase
MVIVNDYEFELLRQKTGLNEAEVLETVQLLVVTKGEHGSTVMWGGGHVDVPAVVPDRIADPTGVGDAYRAGFLKGLAMGASAAVCGRLGSVAAAYVLEHIGAQSHAYSWLEFVRRYEQHFGPLTITG